MTIMGKTLKITIHLYGGNFNDLCVNYYVLFLSRNNKIY